MTPDEVRTVMTRLVALKDELRGTGHRVGADSHCDDRGISWGATRAELSICTAADLLWQAACQLGATYGIDVDSVGAVQP